MKADNKEYANAKKDKTDTILKEIKRNTKKPAFKSIKAQYFL